MPKYVLKPAILLTADLISQTLTQMRRNRSYSTAVSPRGQPSSTVEQLSRLGPAPRPSLPASWVSGGAADEIVKCVALRSFRGEREDDLSFEQDDIIEVARPQLLQPAHWWRGFCKGRQGLFPSSHIKIPAEYAALSPPPVDETASLLLPSAEGENQGDAPTNTNGSTESVDTRLTEEDISDIEGELIYEDVEEEGVPGRTTKVIASGSLLWPTNS